MKLSKKLGLLLLHLPTSGTGIRLQARRQGKATGREIVAGSEGEGSVPSITHSFPKCRYINARQKKQLWEKSAHVQTQGTQTSDRITIRLNYTKYAQMTSVCAKSATGLLIL